jgi:hypothetical protein
MSVPNGDFPVDYYGYLQDILDEAEATAADADAEASANIRASPLAALVSKGLAPPNGSVPANGLVPADGLAPADGLILANASPIVAANAFSGEVINVQQSEDGLYVPNSVWSQKFNNVTGAIPSGFQHNQQQALPQLTITQLPTPDGVPPRGESVDSVFHALSSPEARMPNTPSTSPESRSVAMRIPISTPTKKKPAKKSTPRSKTVQPKASSLIKEMVSHQLRIDPLLRRSIYNISVEWPQDPQFGSPSSSSCNCHRILPACLAICSYQPHSMYQGSAGWQPA